MSQILIQNIEDTLSTIVFEAQGIQSWAIVFSQWLESDILQKYWKNNSSMFLPTTVSFVDQLVVVAKEAKKLRKLLKRNLTYDDYTTLLKNVSYTPKGFYYEE